MGPDVENVGRVSTKNKGQTAMKANPLDFNPSPEIASTRAQARYKRLVEAKANGAEISNEEIEAQRVQAFGRRDAHA